MSTFKAKDLHFMIRIRITGVLARQQHQHQRKRGFAYGSSVIICAIFIFHEYVAPYSSNIFWDVSSKDPDPDLDIGT